MEDTFNVGRNRFLHLSETSVLFLKWFQAFAPEYRVIRIPSPTSCSIKCKGLEDTFFFLSLLTLQNKQTNKKQLCCNECLRNWFKAVLNSVQKRAFCLLYLLSTSFWDIIALWVMKLTHAKLLFWLIPYSWEQIWNIILLSLEIWKQCFWKCCLIFLVANKCC